MHRCYRDILDRIDEPVIWFDEAAAPRYEPFAPNLTANIYAVEAALVRIECQSCSKSFDVAFTSPAGSKPLDENEFDAHRGPLLRNFIRARKLHYGDPPNVECCSAGASMNSVPRVVLQYWVQPIAIGEGVGCAWPNRLDPNKPKHREMLARGDRIFSPDARIFRREPALEGIDLTPKWAR